MRQEGCEPQVPSCCFSKLVFFSEFFRISLSFTQVDKRIFLVKSPFTSSRGRKYGFDKYYANIHTSSTFIKGVLCVLDKIKIQNKCPWFQVWLLWKGLSHSLHPVPFGEVGEAFLLAALPHATSWSIASSMDVDHRRSSRVSWETPGSRCFLKTQVNANCFRKNSLLLSLWAKCVCVGIALSNLIPQDFVF